MIAAADLYSGAVVRLASGSIKFTVVRVTAGVAELIGWGDRVGVVELSVPPECLVWPRPADPPFPPEVQP